MKHMIWKILLISVMVFILVACGADSSDSESTENEPVTTEETVEESTETLAITLGGEQFLLDALDGWQILTGSTVSNLDVNVMPLSSTPLDGLSIDEAIERYVSVPEDSVLTPTEFDNLTVYTDDTGTVFVIYAETDLFLFNISVLGDGEFSTYRDEIVQLLGTLRSE
ncbi:MAG: hypothetical protein AAF846_14715 [Chloroflexota bacterium]